MRTLSVGHYENICIDFGTDILNTHRINLNYLMMLSTFLLNVSVNDVWQICFSSKMTTERHFPLMTVAASV